MKYDYIGSQNAARVNERIDFFRDAAKVGAIARMGGGQLPKTDYVEVSENITVDETIPVGAPVKIDQALPLSANIPVLPLAASDDPKIYGVVVYEEQKQESYGANEGVTVMQEGIMYVKLTAPVAVGDYVKFDVATQGYQVATAEEEKIGKARKSGQAGDIIEIYVLLLK